MQWNPRWASLKNKQKLVRYFGFSVLPSANKPYRWATDDQLESMNERMGYVLLIVVTDSIYFVAWAGLLFADGRLYYIIQMQTRLHLRTSPSVRRPPSNTFTPWFTFHRCPEASGSAAECVRTWPPITTRWAMVLICNISRGWWEHTVPT